MDKRKIVITGGPGTGKTSVINHLKGQGYHCFDEIIRLLTSEAKKEVDTSNHISNPIVFAKDPLEFNTRLLNGRIEQFNSANALEEHTCFFDRGIPDVLAYMDYFNQPYDSVFENACTNHNYSKVFLLPPWKAIYKTDSARFETYEELEQIHKCLKSTYKAFGYTIIEVPFGSVDTRTSFILNKL